MEIETENQAVQSSQRTENLAKTPVDFHLEFVRLGRERYKLMNRLLLILPDIYESGIYKKYAKDIYKYAGRFGGISRSAVDKRLRLEKHLEEKPQLRAAIEKVGINKVALVATLATPKTEALFADKVLNMNKSAIQTLSKEIRQRETYQDNQDHRDYQRHWSPTDIQPCSAKPQTMTIELDAEMTFLFLKLKKKYKNLNNKEVMRRILEQADQSTGQSDSAKKSEMQVQGRPPLCSGLITGDNFQTSTIEPRSIKIAKKRQTIGNGKCQYPGCNHPAAHIHHPERYGKTKNHNNLIALCEDHHQFMHNGLIENEQAGQEYWALNLYKTPDEIDEQYRKYRNKSLS